MKMNIENFEELKNWLSRTLEPICDADPSALAKYVLALVKKDKNERELKALCIDQLEVFLQKETHGFVDQLFEALTNHSYLPPPEMPLPVTSKVEFYPEKEIKKEKEFYQDKEIKREKEFYPDKEIKKEKEEVIKDDDREKKFSRRINHSPQQSSSRHRENRSRDRKKDDRSRKRDYDRNPPRRDSYRDRYNRRRGRSRSYSRSRSRSRSWSKDRLRDRDQSRSRSRTRSRTQSRERDPGKPKYDLERTDPLENSYTPVSSVSNITTAHYPVPTLSSSISVISRPHHGNSTTENWTDFHEDQVDHSSYARPPLSRKRCRDYDEQGFCLKGDMCPFDHGSDPVVVEDVNLPGMLPFPAQPPVVEGPPPPGLPPPPPILTPPVNLRPPVPPPGPLPPSLPPSLPPVTGPPPPLPPLQPTGMDAPPIPATTVPTIVTGILLPPPPVPPLFTAVSETYDTDGYNPEAPGITNPSRPMYRHRVNAQRPNLIGLTSGDMDLPSREKPINNNNSRIVLDSESRKRTIGAGESVVPPKRSWFDKFQPPRRNFNIFPAADQAIPEAVMDPARVTGTDFSHHNKRQNFNRTSSPSFPKKAPFGSENTKLELRRIPTELNNISKLNEHFSKFGNLVNLQVAYQGDPEGALLQFATSEEAKAAMSSTEAVLNNRFIKVFWHREGNSQQMQGSPQKVVHPPVQQSSTPPTVKQSVKDRLGPVPSSNVEPAEPQHSNSEVPQNVTLSVKDRLGFVSKPTAAASDKVLSTSTGLTKTVYNLAALKALQKSLPTTLDASDALKKKQEAFRLQQDVRKKKQEILEKHIETQKILISRLEKNKSMKSEDKADIMKTLEILTNSITKLKDELKAASAGATPAKVIKTKAQTQKELLDTELDLYNKIQSGEDVTELRRKYTELQLEAAKRGILSTARGRGRGRGRGIHARGRGMSRGRGRGLRCRGRGLHAVVDHRPRALEISAFQESDREDLLPHFAQFGEIEDCRIDDSSLHAVITFKTRSEAEAAAVHGARFKGQDLKMAWNKPVTSMSTTETEDAEQDEEEFQEETLVDDTLLQDDDEEEEENESRSWRR